MPELVHNMKSEGFNEIYGDEQLLSTSNTFKNQQFLMTSLKKQYLESIFSEEEEGRTGSSEADSVRLNFN